MMKRKLIAALVSGLLVLPSLATAQQTFSVKPLVEKKVTELPAGDLFWRIETFDSKEQAQAAAGPLGLVAEYEGKVWLFELGRAGEASKGGKRVAEIGPLPKVNASQYLLRINEAGGPPGSVTPVHTHPGSEAFYVLAGELTQRTPQGVARVSAGQTLVGHAGDVPMEVLSSGSSELKEFALFVVDATKPFSSPAHLH
ncbi:cupin domain-containing protein [Microvirga sp. SYSU G3D207]|uniref:Cupin domain-containing protein n=2 Tax=Microvirga arsenatis TaxID=2692265 RepID=A0ABW9Z0X9_9HYPH|nr:cupin domain-containing protein [Microvirga arsenatis]NBJ11328.1 cupin domain-containing protein [Microvirga arsenatis]NBJ25601.1 cupin domain-containing protein [Microvirga arsenatis]